MYSYEFVLITFAAILIGTASTTCLINLETPIGSKTPIVLDSEGYMLVPDNRSGDISFQDGDRIQFLCSGNGNYLIDRATIGPTSNATCSNNRFILDANRGSYAFARLQCHNPPQSAAKEVGTCNTNSKKIRLGFEVNQHRFIAKIEICFDARRLVTYWSRHILQTSPYSCHVGDSTNFKKNFFGTTDPNVIYSNNPAFDRGHLTPVCDYVTGAEKRMTYYYINAAPQVSDFNKKNWKSLEGVIRTYTDRQGQHMYIYTGTTDIVRNLGGVLPLPRYFWKVVINSISGAGVAFVGVNNVDRNIPNPCPTPSICRNLQWLGQSFLAKVDDIAKGKIYCCAIPSFRQIPNIQLPLFPEFRGGVIT